MKSKKRGEQMENEAWVNVNGEETKERNGLDRGAEEYQHQQQSLR
jgi:hypothetical protein